MQREPGYFRYSPGRPVPSSPSAERLRPSARVAEETSPADRGRSPKGSLPVTSDDIPEHWATRRDCSSPSSSAQGPAQTRSDQEVAERERSPYA